jgi:hypothetical protein
VKKLGMDNGGQKYGIGTVACALYIADNPKL